MGSLLSGLFSVDFDWTIKFCYSKREDSFFLQFVNNLMKMFMDYRQKDGNSRE